MYIPQAHVCDVNAQEIKKTNVISKNYSQNLYNKSHCCDFTRTHSCLSSFSRNKKNLLTFFPTDKHYYFNTMQRHCYILHNYTQCSGVLFSFPSFTSWVSITKCFIN